MIAHHLPSSQDIHANATHKIGVAITQTLICGQDMGSGASPGEFDDFASLAAYAYDNAPDVDPRRQAGTKTHG
jgi:hypothetical protein